MLSSNFRRRSSELVFAWVRNNWVSFCRTCSCCWATLNCFCWASCGFACADCCASCFCCFASTSSRRALSFLSSLRKDSFCPRSFCNALSRGYAIGFFGISVCIFYWIQEANLSNLGHTVADQISLVFTGEIRMVYCSSSICCINLSGK